MKKLLLFLLLLLVIALLAYYQITNQNTATEETVADESSTAYQSPIDFPALEAENADVYAWVSVTGTEISYPIYQNEIDDTFYIDTNRLLEADALGEVFTQSSYNSQDFTDPHTVLYGHTDYSGSENMFSSLSDFADSDFFAEHTEIIIYLPTCEYHYEIFAFYRWTDEHLLYNYQTTDETLFASYLNKVLAINSTSANINTEISLDGTDQIITLSTCVEKGTTERYLLQAVLVE